MDLNLRKLEMDLGFAFAGLPADQSEVQILKRCTQEMTAALRACVGRDQYAFQLGQRVRVKSPGCGVPSVGFVEQIRVNHKLNRIEYGVTPGYRSCIWYAEDQLEVLNG